MLTALQRRVGNRHAACVYFKNMGTCIGVAMEQTNTSLSFFRSFSMPVNADRYRYYRSYRRCPKLGDAYSDSHPLLISDGKQWPVEKVRDKMCSSIHNTVIRCNLGKANLQSAVVVLG